MNGLILASPLVAGGVLAAWAPSVARRLPPKQATWLLSAGGAIAAAGSLAVLLLAASPLVGQEPELAEHGHWSVTALRAHAPLGTTVAIVALCCAGALALGLSVAAIRRGRALLAAYRSCNHVRAMTGELVVLPHAHMGAYAVPGRPGRIVIGQRLLASLPADQRRALIAHERAHLTHGHHWHLAATRVAAAANPLLLPLRRASERAVERWADEAAGEDVGSRRVVARTLARSALAGVGPPSAALAAAGHAVPERVAALLAPPPRPRPLLLRVSALLLLTTIVAVVVATKQTEHLFEFAQSAQSSTQVR